MKTKTIYFDNGCFQFLIRITNDNNEKLSSFEQLYNFQILTLPSTSSSDRHFSNKY